MDAGLLEVVAVGAALGLVLGLLGGGGGVLAVPLFVYLLDLPVDVATTMSLVVVAIGAAAGLVQHARAGRVDWRIGLGFGALGVVGAVVGSRLSVWVPERLLLFGFVLLLLAAAWSMLRPAGTTEDDEGPARTAAPWPTVLAVATAVGFTTGFFGVGGGFVVVPALVVAVRLPMRRATATGLLVIIVNSVVSLLARAGGVIDVGLTVELSLAAALAAIGGAMLSPRVAAGSLKRAFGVLILAAAAYTAWHTATV